MSSKIYIFSRFLFLSICYIPLGLLMFIGKPDRLQGLLYDIENFIGLHTFANLIFFGGYIVIGIETLRFLLKRKKSKYFPLILGLLFFGILYGYSINNNIFYKKEKVTPTQVTQNTLLIATEGSLYNFNLETNTISWKYSSALDAGGNRNLFVIDKQNIFLPFESGKLINFNVNTGAVVWKQQIYGRKNSGTEITTNSGDEIVHIDGLAPLFMAQPLVDKQKIIIASHGNPQRTAPFLYNFDKITGKIIWKKLLPTHFNLFAPVKYKSYPYDYYFINSAVFLEKYGAETGSRYSYGMFENEKRDKDFERPIYAQMQTDGKNIFIGDENGKFYGLPLDKNANTINSLDISNPENTFRKNPSVFKWIFSDDVFTFQSNTTTFLEDDLLYTVIKNSNASKSAIFAINTTNGTLKWKKIIPGSILNWTLTHGKIIGNTSETIFYLDEANYNEFNSTNKPLSNIEVLDKDRFVYVTQNGIEIFDTKKKKGTLIYAKKFNDNPHNTMQLKFIPK